MGLIPLHGIFKRASKMLGVSPRAIRDFPYVCTNFLHVQDSFLTVDAIDKWDDSARIVAVPLDEDKHSFKIEISCVANGSKKWKARHTYEGPFIRNEAIDILESFENIGVLLAPVKTDRLHYSHARRVLGTDYQKTPFVGIQSFKELVNLMKCVTPATPSSDLKL